MLHYLELARSANMKFVSQALLETGAIDMTPEVEKALKNLQDAIDAKLKAKGSSVNRRWVVEELKIVNPSSCEALDVEVAAMMKDASPQFAEPREDLDGNGWTRIPRIQLKLVD